MRKNEKKRPLTGIQILPSILAGDFGCLAEEAKKAELSGADALHIDIMDGHFVPNLTFGPKAVAAINRATTLFLDIHLMIYNPFDYIEKFVEAGADRLTFHIEATEQSEKILNYIKKCNVQSGLAFSPGTSHEMIPRFLPLVDVILLMTVDPGFGGQPFIQKMIKKISYIRKLADQLSLPLDIQVDGGIDDKTAKECVKAGANLLVSGSYLYQASNMKEAVQKLRGV